jgi:hypothetical protein
MKAKSRVLASLAFALLVPAAVSAHHSFAMFDMSKTLTMKGVVKELQWTNPHVWLDLLVVNPAGTPEVWGFEGQPTNAMMRHGWTRNSVKSGDKVTVTVHPLRNGNRGGSLLGVTLENGTQLHLGVQGANPEETGQ